ncbi:MAG: tetratricopeptide repeat protein [Spirochaetia bacterium]
MNRFVCALVLFSTVSLAVSAQESTQKDALALYREGSYEKAIEVCREELEIMPKRMDAYVVMGWSLLRLGRYDQAIDEAKKGYAISPSDFRIIEILGEAYFYRGNNQQALNYFEQYVVLAPTGDRIDQVYYFMGEIFIRLEEYNHADIALSTALYHTPSIAKWWARLGYSREMAADYKWALDAYEKALQLNADFTEARRGIERVREKMEIG